MNDFAGLCTTYRTQLQLKSSNLAAQISSRFRTIGAICESSRWLAERMHRAITDPAGSAIVELGAGYGSITQILPEHAVSIERDPARYDYLKERFPDREILDCCAVTYLSSLSDRSTVVSSIPSVNNPEFERLRSAVAHGHKHGAIVELITYTYFPHNPFEGIFPVEERTWIELLNVPPAFVWRYRC